MIDSVEININCGIYQVINAFVDYNNKKCYMNNKYYDVDDIFLEELKKILYTFKKEYGSKNIIDVEEFEIIVNSKGDKDRFHGKGVYPNNYQELKKLLERLK